MDRRKSVAVDAPETRPSAGWRTDPMKSAGNLPLGPLAGLRILDLATVMAGPMASTLLSDYGAEVLKVELPGRGDGVRYYPPYKDGKSLWWKVVNRNKRMVTLDLRKLEGVGLLKRLLPEFDVLVENFRPGTLDRWGLDRDVLWSINPRLVILRVTGFGQSGAYRDRPGFARIFESLGGMAYISGEPDGEPMHVGYPIGDAIGGIFGALSIMTALWPIAKNPERRGEEIDLALTECVLKLMDVLHIEYEQLGIVRERSGNDNQYSAPAVVARTRDDRWFSLAGGTDALFGRNVRAMGRPELAEDPRFASNTGRVANAAILNDIFRRWCATQTAAQVIEAFRAAGGTIAPIYSAADIAADPHFADREALVDVRDHDHGTVRMAGVVPRFANSPTALRHSAGDLGQDNDEVFGGWLGISDDELRRLRDDRVI